MRCYFPFIISKSGNISMRIVNIIVSILIAVLFLPISYASHYSVFQSPVSSTSHAIFLPLYIYLLYLPFSIDMFSNPRHHIYSHICSVGILHTYQSVKSVIAYNLVNSPSFSFIKFLFRHIIFRYQSIFYPLNQSIAIIILILLQYVSELSLEPVAVRIIRKSLFYISRVYHFLQRFSAS